MQQYQLSDHELALWLQYIEYEIGFILPRVQWHWVKTVIERQLRLHQLSSTELLSQMVDNTPLYHQLLDDILIPRTQFFRHLPTFEFVAAYAQHWQQHVYENVDTAHLPLTLPTLNAWSAGCASGQEAVSIALTLHEMLGDCTRFMVYGSDFHQQALASAKQGCYGIRERDFIPQNYHGQLRPMDERKFGLAAHLQARLHYFSKNLVDEKQPMPLAKGQCQLIMCKNVLIYFRQFEQRDVVRFLSRYLSDDGVLLLGAGQTTMVHEPTLLKLPLGTINGYCKRAAPLWLRRLVQLDNRCQTPMA